ncbi:SWIM zinc finger family protein, partial [Streptomyces sp. SID10815]|uniref:SWIM zinc finger family protein n=1 Tax=Streptomyces sp. SID10815 TaxID=2706027 RepID=UPI0013CD6991
MTQQGVRRTADQVLALAPDDASRRAGSRLATAGPWSAAGSSDEGAVWGLCEGSGKKPYRTVVDLADGAAPAYTCTCPSRKFPCKHALGLLLLWAGDEAAAPAGQAPDWAKQWLSGRR